MYDDILNHVFRCFRDCIETGIEEEPQRFKYLTYVARMLDELEIDHKQAEQLFFDKIVKEFISYLAY